MANLDAGARVTAEQVRDIISTAMGDGPLHAMINTAHLVVEQRLAGKSLDPELLTQIELWLSAHFVAMREPRAKSVKVDDTQITYQSVGDGELGLKSTSFGQQALALDPTNSLASSGLKRAVIRSE